MEKNGNGPRQDRGGEKHTGRGGLRLPHELAGGGKMYPFPKTGRFLFRIRLQTPEGRLVGEAERA
jgi:hypothetical protein